MKIELFPIQTGDAITRTVPGFLLSVYKPRPGDRPFFHIGRLYVGYVGLMWITRWFSLTIWIHNIDKGRAK